MTYLHLSLEVAQMPTIDRLQSDMEGCRVAVAVSVKVASGHASAKPARDMDKSGGVGRTRTYMYMGEGAITKRK
jgi:hypothetical protein